MKSILNKKRLWLKALQHIILLYNIIFDRNNKAIDRNWMPRNSKTGIKNVQLKVGDVRTVINSPSMSFNTLLYLLSIKSK